MKITGTATVGLVVIMALMGTDLGEDIHLVTLTESGAHTGVIGVQVMNLMKKEDADGTSLTTHLQ